MKNSIRVMHFADTHFGVELHGRLDPETGLNTRLKDFKKSLMSAMDLALDAGIQLAVFAGDAYKTRDPRATDQREFAACIRRLTDQSIPVVLLTGNHDMPAVSGKAHAVEIYHTLGVTHVTVLNKAEIVVVPTAMGPVRIAALPYINRGYSFSKELVHGKTVEEARALVEQKYCDDARRLAEEVRRADDQVPTILLGHFWARGAKLSDWQRGYFQLNEPQVPLEALTDPAFDYVALGHVHRHQDLNPSRTPHVVYSGSPDRIDFGEKDETKGFVILDLWKGGANYRFVPIAEGRPFIDIEVDVDASCEDPTARIVQEIKKWPLRNAVVKLTYKILDGKQQFVRDRDIREALAPAFLVASISRSVQRDPIARSKMLTESLRPREALELYIDTRPNLKTRKELLLRYADPLITELIDAG
ncbi:MAG TPA: exonuclease SbcCD subunit D [Chthonomonadales bacterium]|nr:exonuclease SbcCD subunit D [Chthonomonadales bacterium]